jgi:hypothetical protein
MNEGRPHASQSDGDQENRNRGPNLTLIYSLIVLAMIAAIAIAALVVLPFYHRR